MLQFEDCLPAGNITLIVSVRCESTEQWVLHFQAQEYAVVIQTMYKDSHDWADCVGGGFIQIVKQANKMNILPVRAIFGWVYLVRVYAVSDGIDIVALLNSDADLESYSTGC